MELTLDQALQKGIEAHKAGKAEEADRCYTAILKANPKHPDANHNMGVLAVGVGKVREALPFFKTALEANPNIAQYWLSYIDALIKLERMAEAKAVFDQAKSKGAKGDGFDKIEKSLVGLEQGKEVNAGSIKTQEPPKDQLKPLINLYGQGQYQKAQTQASKLLERFPNSVNLYNIIGATNQSLGKLDEAIEAYKKALLIEPDFIDVHNNMGNALQKQGKLDEAIEAFKKVLSIEPKHADAYNNMGVVLKDQGQLDEALEAYNKALSLKPDYAEAYDNIIKILKVWSPKSERSHRLFTIDSKIKKLSAKMLYAKSNKEIINNLLEGFSYISEAPFDYRSALSQIYKRNGVDLNCKRHKKIFGSKDIIPEFCFGCFKVQVQLDTFLDLIKVTSLFYKFEFEEDLSRKTIIELRPNVSGYYKGFIYCKGLDQAHAVKHLLDIDLKQVFGDKIASTIKRGCSEYLLKFPDYGTIPKEPNDMMKFPQEWKLIENQFDQNELIKPKKNISKSLKEFCASDFYIIQKWIDYAKGIGDESIVAFNNMPIVFKDVYEKAKIRTMR